MTQVGLPFRNTLWYYVQTDYDTAPTMTDVALPVGCEWHVGRVTGADKHIENFSADSPVPCILWEQVDDFTFHLEYVPQCDDTLLADMLNRDSEGFLQSLAFMLGTNVNLTADADKSYYEVVGCKPDRVGVASSINNKYVFSIDFSVKSVITNGGTSFITNSLTDLAAEKPSALTGDYLGFNVAGSITKGGAEMAHIVDSIDLTFEHNIDNKFDHDSKTKQYAVEGAYSVSGSATLSMDEGGGVRWSEVINQDTFEVVVNLGKAGCPKITIPNCKWLNPEAEGNNEGTAVMKDCRFTGIVDIENVVGTT